MPRKGKQLDEKQKLKRDLREQIALREFEPQSPEWHAAIKRRVMRIGQLTETDRRRRDARWIAMGRPEYHSPEWQAELARLRPGERRKRPRVPPGNTDSADHRSLYWVLMYLQARMSWNETHRHPPLPVRALDVAALERASLRLTSEGRITLPGQRQERHTQAQQAEARRMYRWLWRTFPGLLNACDDELRALIREAGGAA